MNTDSDTFCIMPWFQLNMGLAEDYKPCCNTGKAYIDENNKPLFVSDYSIQEAFDSVTVSKLRKQLDSNKRPSICNVCWAKEDAGVWSERQEFNKFYKQYIHEYTQPELKFIDIEFDNVCNLQCRMCSQYNSDQLWKTYNEFKQRKLTIPTSLNDHSRGINYRAEEKKNFVKEILKDIDIFKVTGGEPFLSKQFLEVINFAIEEDLAKNITLRATTNGTKFSKTLLSKLKHFKKVKLTISIDGTNKVYDYIRYPFTWEHINKRLLEVDEHNWLDVELSCVVQVYNWLNLDKLINYSKHYVNFDFKLWPPGSELSVGYLPDSILDLGLERIRKTNHKQIKDFENFVDYSKTNKLSHNQLERKNDQLYETTINYDIVREQSYKTLDPVLVKWLDSLKT